MSSIYTISETDSEIIHVLDTKRTGMSYGAWGKVNHVIQKIVKTTSASAPEYVDFALIKKESRKIRGGEFDDYYTGRLYTYTYYKYLD